MMKIYARLAAAVLIACFSAGLSACNSFHEWPEGGGDDPTLIRTTLRLHVDCTPFAEGAGQAAESSGDYQLRWDGRPVCRWGRFPKREGRPGGGDQCRDARRRNHLRSAVRSACR